METNSSYGIKIAVRYLISALISFFLYLSVMVIMTGAFAQEIGYTVCKTETGEVLYEHYFSSGEDTQYAQYQSQGIELSKTAIRSTLSSKPQFITDVICQILTAAITFAFVYNTLWKLGDGDSNLVNFSHINEDKLRGFKIGLIAVIPTAVSFLLAILGKAKILPSAFIALYRFMNYQFFALINIFFGRLLVDYSSLSWSGLLGSASIMIILPVMCGVSYILGYNDFSLLNKLIYKNKKETK